MEDRARQTEQTVTFPQLREAEEGLRRLLFKKRFSREWIERHLPEVMAQARADLAVRMAAEVVHDPVALLVVIAYRRALKIVRAERTGPRVVPLDEVFHPVDERARTPEEEVIDTDRQTRLLDAMRHLPEKELKLLALHYFGEMSVKEAGRQVGWSPSTAIRHQRTALETLKSLVGERSLLGVDLGASAMILSGYVAPRPQLAAWMDTAVGLVREVATFGAQRYAPVAESGQALALSGAGRTTAGVCGLAVAACLGAVTSGVVGPGAGILDGSRPAGERPRHERVDQGPSPEPRSPVASSAPLASEPTPPTTQEDSAGQNPRPAARGANPPQARRARPIGAGDTPFAATAPPEPTASEFGLEGEGAATTRAEAPAPARVEAAPVSPAAPASPSAPPPPSTAPSTGNSGGSSEFGM